MTYKANEGKEYEGSRAPVSVSSSQTDDQTVNEGHSRDYFTEWIERNFSYYPKW